MALDVVLESLLRAERGSEVYRRVQVCANHGFEGDWQRRRAVCVVHRRNDAGVWTRRIAGFVRVHMCLLEVHGREGTLWVTWWFQQHLTIMPKGWLIAWKHPPRRQTSQIILKLYFRDRYEEDAWQDFGSTKKMTFSTVDRTSDKVLADKSRFEWSKRFATASVYGVRVDFYHSQPLPGLGLLAWLHRSSSILVFKNCCVVLLKSSNKNVIHYWIDP